MHPRPAEWQGPLPQNPLWMRLSSGSWSLPPAWVWCCHRGSGTCNHALQTLAAHNCLPLQAYGAKNYASVGITLQRALLICLVALAAMLPLWFSMEHVLLALGTRALQSMSLCRTCQALLKLCSGKSEHDAAVVRSCRGWKQKIFIHAARYMAARHAPGAGTHCGCITLQGRSRGSRVTPRNSCG